MTPFFLSIDSVPAMGRLL